MQKHLPTNLCDLTTTPCILQHLITSTLAHPTLTGFSGSREAGVSQQQHFTGGDPASHRDQEPGLETWEQTRFHGFTMEAQLPAQHRQNGQNWDRPAGRCAQTLL